MRTLLIPAAVAALLATSAIGFAASHTNGRVKTYDHQAMTLTLEDGSTFMLKKDFKDPGLKSGERVRVSWDKNGSTKVADSVTIRK